MRTDEFMTIAAALRTYFPRFNMLPNEEAMELWYNALQDLSYESVSAALQKWITTEKWPPSIAELRELSGEMTHGKLPDWGEGWAEVQKTLQRYGWNRPDDAKAALSPVTRAAVERIGWGEICRSENADTIRAQFRQVYEICSRNVVEDRQLPQALKDTIAQIGRTMTPQLEGRT